MISPLRLIRLLGLLAWPMASASAATFHIAPDGDDAAPGSAARPLATVQKGHDLASPGDTLLLRSGTFRLEGNRTEGVTLSKDGLPGRPIHVFAAPGAAPVLDASGLTAMGRITGIRITGDGYHLRGLELKGVPQRITTAHESWGIWVSGSRNVFERLDIHHIQGPGLFIADGGDNLVVDCDSHDNYDPLSSNGAGENADGFGCHSSLPGNVFRGCRAWWNSDDGYDVIAAEAPVRFEANWAFLNGYLPGTRTSSRNGAGFKVGKSSTGVRHFVTRCLSFENKAQGFYANHSLGGNDWIHNTAWNNGGYAFDMLSDTVLSGSKVHLLRNNAAGGGNLVGNRGASDSRSNSWDLGLAVTAGDFLSASFAGADAKRNPDGSLPRPDYLRLRPGSALVDAGTVLGPPHAGEAPDLGAYETGVVVTVVARGWQGVGIKTFGPAGFDAAGRRRPGSVGPRWIAQGRSLAP